MTLLELRCTRCDAPLEASSGAVLTCRFCGATMERASAALAPQVPVREVFFLKVGRIGPSNRPRVAKAISDYARMPLEAATKLVASSPCEIGFERDSDTASITAREIIEAGGEADVESRFIAGEPIVILPNRSVSLDDAGPHHVAVIKVVREFIDLGMAEAKHLVDSAPCVLTKSMEGGRAKTFHDALVEAGATARIG